jgi:hypothetical protein
VSAFADPEIIKMCTEQFVSVTGDDWYQRRRKDAEGKFFMALSTGFGKEGDGSRQGVYIFAADGTPLGYKNATQSAQVTKELMIECLVKFKKLPPNKRQPGAIKVEDQGPLDPQYARVPPAGGLVLSVNTRILEQKNGTFRKGACQALGGDHSARDHMWIQAEEVKDLVPEKREVGFKFPVPEAIAERLARFHLIDNTRGEPPTWSREQVRSRRMELTVVSVTADFIDLSLDGDAVMATDADLSKANIGYEVRLGGRMRYSLKKNAFEKFEIVALGQHWGDHAHMQPARPGKTHLGVSIEIAGNKPGDKVPPQGSRWLDGYYGKG